MPQVTFQRIRFKEQQERAFVSSKKQKEKGNPKYFQHFFQSAKVIETGPFPRRFCLRRFLFQWKILNQKFPRRVMEEPRREGRNRDGGGPGSCSEKQPRSSLLIPTKPAAHTLGVPLHPACVGHAVHAGQLEGSALSRRFCSCPGSERFGEQEP